MGEEEEKVEVDLSADIMSWISRLLSPRKRRADDDAPSFTKRIRALGEDLVGNPPPKISCPFDEKDVIAYEAKQDKSELGSLLLRQVSRTIYKMMSGHTSSKSAALDLKATVAMDVNTHADFKCSFLQCSGASTANTGCIIGPVQEPDSCTFQLLYSSLRRSTLHKCGLQQEQLTS